MTGLSATPNQDSLTPPKTVFQKHYSRGLELLKDGKAEEGARRFMQAAIADPEKWCELSIEIGRVGDVTLALACLAELLKISKANHIRSATWCAIGNIYSNEGAREHAMECFVKSWDLNPHPGSASNRALIHLWNEEVSDAERWISRSLELNPWIPEAQFVQAMITLVGRGHYRTGFKQYECRWRSKQSGLRKLNSQVPEWPGPEVNKGRLLVYGEQGMGDTILALRYAEKIRVLGLKQTWVIQPSLKTLAESMGVIDEVKNPGEEFRDYNFHISAISLVRAFGTSLETIPPAPYLRSISWPSSSKLKVGICWKGSSVNRNNPIRSAPLAQWSPILNLVDRFEFHSFQVDGAEEALTWPMLKMHPAPKDWLETSQRLSAMDLLVTVDSAMAHLAGAMGKRCLCALHCRPYFVYPIMRADCPWYPSVKLFKQKKEHEWKDVFEAIAKNLYESAQS